MKKFVALSIVVIMLIALAVPALAQGNLFSKGNEWFYTANEAGTVTVRDNKRDFTYEVQVGNNFLGRQSGYTGQLRFVSFVSYCVSLGHEFINDTGKSFADCENTFNEAVCSRLGCNVVGKRWVGPGLGHEFINDTGRVIIQRTCTEDGLLEAACSRLGCDEIGTRFLPALGHTETTRKAGACWSGIVEITSCSICEVELSREVVYQGDHSLARREYGQLQADGTWKPMFNPETGKHLWIMVCTVDGCNQYGVTNQDCDCEECVPPAADPFTRNADGSITINVDGFYTAAEFGNPGTGRAWRVNNSSSIQNGSGFSSGNLNAGDIIYNVRNQNEQ